VAQLAIVLLSVFFAGFPSHELFFYLLLVVSIFVLLSNSISHNDLSYPENQLHAFVSKFESVYGLASTTLATTVRE